MRIRIVFLFFIFLIIPYKWNNKASSKTEEKSLLMPTIATNDKIPENDTNVVPLISIGKYRSINENGEFEDGGCAIEIEIKENSKYTISIRDIQYKKGIYYVLIEEDTYINFENLQGLYYNDTIVIQNYGNMMNEYIHFESCDKKYIYLTKILE